MLYARAPDEVMCRAFPSTLDGHTHLWFSDLSSGSISSFKQLSKRFTSYFGTSRTIKHTAHCLKNVVQGKNEYLKDFLIRFTKEAREIQGLKMEVALSYLTDNLRSKLFCCSITRKPPKTMAELLERSIKYIVFEEALQLNFKTTNNQAEYEALIAGLRLAKELGAQRATVHSDSQLVNVILERIPREENERADSLSKLASQEKSNSKHSIGATRKVLESQKTEKYKQCQSAKMLLANSSQEAEGFGSTASGFAPVDSATGSGPASFNSITSSAGASFDSLAPAVAWEPISNTASSAVAFSGIGALGEVTVDSKTCTSEGSSPIISSGDNSWEASNGPFHRTARLVMSTMSSPSNSWYKFKCRSSNSTCGLKNHT
ncbi:uncharacterized protein G2W53_021729 [Senna tora]|uniref:Uncharacterized protein n=1 Tax=Senna tora TaxID=362788 RepID=A0A834TMN4_9FABA|nr:uncharacterized protein G2W53_021729 [Senna tora]